MSYPVVKNGVAPGKITHICAKCGQETARYGISLITLDMLCPICKREETMSEAVALIKAESLKEAQALRDERHANITKSNNTTKSFKKKNKPPKGFTRSKYKRNKRIQYDEEEYYV